ncbi:cysteine-rich CWC family protein [Chishuiella sp.]|uniref:cysteine-rich CWC family protein n=1 Tax=Chishuiella sp. TaxID=1969467 RepID=UPI0028AC7898|nr:cysteine-rich CWC family protein [Chishuiella sp.]
MNKKCGRCSKNFNCNTSQIEACHCSTTVLLEEARSFLLKTSYDCLCNDCLEDINNFAKLSKQYKFPQTPQEYILNVHYYIENGFWVFTEFFHYQKGICCKNNCRHCAYGYSK